MTPIFEFVFACAIGVEGGFVDHPADKGGPTKFGITIGTLKSWRGSAVSSKDIKNLTLEEARQIYYEKYFVPNNLTYLSDKKIACVLFDQIINQGASAPSRRAVDTLREMGLYDGADTRLTPEVCSKLEALQWAGKSDEFLIRYLVKSQQYYGDIVRRNPSQQVFLRGWINRTHKLFELIWE